MTQFELVIHKCYINYTHTKTKPKCLEKTERRGSLSSWVLGDLGGSARPAELPYFVKLILFVSVLQHCSFIDVFHLLNVGASLPV